MPRLRTLIIILAALTSRPAKLSLLSLREAQSQAPIDITVQQHHVALAPGSCSLITTLPASTLLSHWSSYCCCRTPSDGTAGERMCPPIRLRKSRTMQHRCAPSLIPENAAALRSSIDRQRDWDGEDGGQGTGDECTERIILMMCASNCRVASILRFLPSQPVLLLQLQS